MDKPGLEIGGHFFWGGLKDLMKTFRGLRLTVSIL